MLYCTLLATAEGEADRDRIMEEMKGDPAKAVILKVSCGWGILLWIVWAGHIIMDCVGGK